MHTFALRLIGAALGWPMTNGEIVQSLITAEA
jgi:hypothetical protein